MSPSPAREFEGRTVLVTGGSRGIGKAVARAFHEAGARVVICGRDPAALVEAARDIGEILCLPADVRRDARRLVAGLRGRLDILVNNAGIDIIKPAVDYTEAEWDQIVDINLKGYFLCAQAAGRVMIGQRRGSILMNSSIAGSIGIQGLVPYASAKGGVNQLTRTLAVEWAPYNVRVNAFSPGYFENVMQGVEAVHNEAKERHIREWTPLGRRGRLEELIGPLVFLASDASSYVTGHILMVDGGWTAA